MNSATQTPVGFEHFVEALGGVPYGDGTAPISDNNRQGLLVAEVALITVQPAVQVLDYGKPAAIIQGGGELGEPGP
jgi:hypothetical protein